MPRNKDLALVEARTEYTKHLYDILNEIVYSKFTHIFETSKENTKNKSDILINFQKELRKVPEWNRTELNDEVTKVTDKCPWFTDLMSAIFVSTIKILTSVKMNKKKSIPDGQFLLKIQNFPLHFDETLQCLPQHALIKSQSSLFFLVSVFQFCFLKDKLLRV